jgi:hypothetical protein
VEAETKAISRKILMRGKENLLKPTLLRLRIMETLMVKVRL